MCFDDEAGPPIPPMAGGSVATERLHLTSGDGTRFAAFAASASATPSASAMLVLPDVRGLHRYYEELAMRFAEAGIDALAIDYFGRTATTDDRSDDFRFMDHVSRTAYPTMTADIEAGAAQLRAAGQRRLFTIGFCFGGRLALLTPTMPGVDASGAVGFYGPPVGSNRVGVPAPADLCARQSGAGPGDLRRCRRQHPARRRGHLRGGSDGRRRRTRDRDLPGGPARLLRSTAGRLRGRLGRRLAQSPRLRARRRVTSPGAQEQQRRETP